MPSNSRSFSVSPAPHPADALELFKTFAIEADMTPRTADVDARLFDVVSHMAEQPTELKNFDGKHSMLRFTVSKKEQMAAFAESVKALASLASSRASSLTFLFVPSASGSTKPSKKPFGLTKRDSKALRAPQEKPLLSAGNSGPAAAEASFVPSEPVSPNFAASKVLSGPIPTCFSSKHACEQRTNNCTSHGECILKWSTDTTNDEGSISKQDCFGCACTKPDVRKNKDGSKKTTNYGGAACHKKDIVFPFWLLAGTTVAIMSIIGFGLGMLYDMGNQELPSVIGAGVSGPKGAAR